MELIKLYAELIVNPKNIRIYRRLIEYYRSHNMTNESNAFVNLLKDEFGPNNSHIDEKQ